MTKNDKYLYLLFCCLFGLFSTIGMAEEDKERYLRLQIGNPELKGEIFSIAADNLVDLSQGHEVVFSQMIDDMMTSRFVYVGETHDSLAMHDIQLRIIQALYERDKNLAVGMEMIPVTFQHVLNKWSLGTITEEELIQELLWYETWNFNFGYYEKIFAFVRDQGIPMYGLNIPRDLVTKIRLQGWDALDKEEKKIVPQPDLSHDEHRTLIRTIFESSDLPHQMKGPGLDSMFEGLYRAQSAWDESMAFYVSLAAEKEGRRMVILAGSGHLLYNLGVNRRVHMDNGLPFKTVICLEVSEDRGFTEVTRSLADYIWGLRKEEKSVFPSIGLAFKIVDGLANIVVERDPIDGVAKGADFSKGDIVLSVGGKTFTDINELRIYLAQFRWNDEVTFRLLRKAEELEVPLKFLPQEKNDNQKQEDECDQEL